MGHYVKQEEQLGNYLRFVNAIKDGNKEELKYIIENLDLGNLNAKTQYLMYVLYGFVPNYEDIFKLLYRYNIFTPLELHNGIKKAIAAHVTTLNKNKELHLSKKVIEKFMFLTDQVVFEKIDSVKPEPFATPSYRQGASALYDIEMQLGIYYKDNKIDTSIKPSKEIIAMRKIQLGF